MNVKVQILQILKTLTVVLALGLSSCAGSDSPDVPVQTEETLAELTLRVGVPRNGDTGSRSQSDEFEPPSFRHENIRFLRVIIVRPSGMVEHNRLLAFNGRTDLVSYTFKVKPAEKKQIYLIGNEPASMEATLESISEGKQLDKTAVEGLTLSRPTGAPLIDNTGSASIWVPMSEHFEVDVISTANGETSQTENLFITRAAVKFSFTFKAGTTDMPYDGYGFEISAIRISNMSTTEYLFPQSTVYSPAKELPSTNPLEGRKVISYATPANSSPVDFTYSPADITAGPGITQYSPAIYLPESIAGTAGTYQISVAFREKDGNGGYLQSAPIWFGPKPLDMTDLPRNTHVYINTTLTKSGIYPKVTIEPFKSIILNPGFGFE